MRRRRSNLVGYRVVGRHGELGVVVDDERLRQFSDETIVVRGGVSDALLYHVPTELFRSISATSRTVTVDADVADFFPRLGQNGTVELHVGR
jgi:hypothetical protein